MAIVTQDISVTKDQLQTSLLPKLKEHSAQKATSVCQVPWLRDLVHLALFSPTWGRVNARDVPMAPIAQSLAC